MNYESIFLKDELSNLFALLYPFEIIVDRYIVLESKENIKESPLFGLFLFIVK
ncbi:hypothetical protein SAMN05216565_107130 [Litchfieldia salsa]|uniref:Uncharacterized protein n=1 Tax=Litchfieldia salsa TaxID=930152 RepID=A0A1H0VQ79_9BACI|nr:hypothetical protein SAMN05216565_107130 [Litchfieldia salsa]